MTVGSAPDPSRPIRIGNCSGFYGDRLSAMREMLEGGELDVLTGDYLAELTMLILGRQRMKDPAAGYARSFLRQLEDCLSIAVARGVRIVSNAGGLNPRGLAEQVRALADRLGLQVLVATVDGDDLLDQWDALVASNTVVGGDGPPTGGGGAPLGPLRQRPLTANAYLGAGGIAAALSGGADVVITGRVTDASLAVGPAAWWYGWQTDGKADLDALAGATVAGHVLECGTQACGGNFSLFPSLLDDPGRLDHIGFPYAEIAADGSSVISKHPGTGGAVTVATVTEQLLYECTGARYGGPDVTSRFDTITLQQTGPDRVAISGVRGEPPSGWLKISTNRLGGFRNSMTVPLVGLDVERKAQVLQRQLAPALEQVEECRVVLARTDQEDAATEEEAAALLHITVKDPDPAKVGKAFTVPVVELALASIPGFFPTTPPGDPAPYGVYAPAWVPAADVPQAVTFFDADGTRSHVVPLPVGAGVVESELSVPAGRPPVDEPARRVPLGRIAGARSGDKGGTCTLGVYTLTSPAYEWLSAFLTTDRMRELLPETAGLPIVREELPSLRAVLFQIAGLLGEGVAAGTRFDPQAKAVGEWLRSRTVDVPVRVLEDA